MIVDWLAQMPVLLVAVLVVFVPGALALIAVGLRGLALLAAAPLFSVVAAAVIALAYGAVGIAWSPASWGIASLLLIVVAWVIGRLVRVERHPRINRGSRWMLPAALIIGALIGAWRLADYISDPASISQTNDAVFHMNAVRYILETSDASSLHVNAVIGGHSFYPAAWHAVVSLIVMITGTSIPIGVNILTVVIGAVIWPLGIAWLTRELTSSPIVAGYAAVLSGALQTFPLLMFQWGVLFPNALSIALVPAAVALVISLPRWSDRSKPWRSGIRALLLVCVATGALALAQPAALLPWAAIITVWLTSWLIGRRSELGLVRVTLFTAASWVSLIWVWLYLAQGTSGSHWPPFRGKFEAVIDVLLNGHVLVPFAYGVSALMIVGLIVAVGRSALRWFALAWFGISALYILVAAFDSRLIRVDLLGAWYADPNRIAALAPIVVIPLAAVGVDAIVRVIARWMGRSNEGAAASVIGLSAATVFMIVLVLVRPVAMPAFLERTYDEQSRYEVSEESYLNADERALLESLDTLVDDDARVLGNPSTGSGFGYFLSGLDVYPRTWSPPKSEAWTLLAASLRDIATQPAVCEALAVYGAPEYVLDFGLGEVGPGRYEMPGMTNFAGQDGFEFVAREGGVSLWRITACAR